MKTQKILIACDGSALSRQILPQVFQLLDPATSDVILLRVAEPVAGLVGTPPRPVAVGWNSMIYEPQDRYQFVEHPIYADQAEASQRDTLEQSLAEERYALEHAGFDVDVEVRFGDPADEIVDCAKTRGVAMIAMATHGRTGLRRLVLGSVAERVLQAARVPVLLFRPFEEAI